jgi:hypothetical protein
MSRLLWRSTKPDENYLGEAFDLVNKAVGPLMFIFRLRHGFRNCLLRRSHLCVGHGLSTAISVSLRRTGKSFGFLGSRDASLQRPGWIMSPMSPVSPGAGRGWTKNWPVLLVFWSKSFLEPQMFNYRLLFGLARLDTNWNVDWPT